MNIEMLDTFVGVARGLFDKELCEEIIAKFKSSKGLQEDVSVGDGKLTFVNLSEHWKDLDKRVLWNMEKLFPKYREMFPELEMYNVSDSGYLVHHYDKGEGSFDWHCDSNHADGSVLTMYVYLNDVEEGGETEFLNQKIKVSPKQGDVLIVPASWTYKHRELASTSGDKYVLITKFIRNVNPTPTKEDNATT